MTKSSKLRPVLLSLYYTAIIFALIYIHGGGTLTPPKFIYQGF